MMEALSAPKSFIPEKMRKLATVAKMTDRTMSNKMVLPEDKIDRMDPWSKNRKGNTRIAESNELMKR